MVTSEPMGEIRSTTSRFWCATNAATVTALTISPSLRSEHVADEKVSDENRAPVLWQGNETQRPDEGEANPLRRYGLALFYTLDENSKPVPCWNVLEWAREFERLHESGRASLGVEQANGWTLSTVFLGIATGPQDCPLLWETIMYRTDDSTITSSWRWSTIEEARFNHAELVDRIRHVHVPLAIALKP